MHRQHQITNPRRILMFVWSGGSGASDGAVRHLTLFTRPSATVATSCTVMPVTSCRSTRFKRSSLCSQSVGLRSAPINNQPGVIVSADRSSLTRARFCSINAAVPEMPSSPLMSSSKGVTSGGSTRGRRSNGSIEPAVAAADCRCI
jgi:hypothetical protein